MTHLQTAIFIEDKLIYFMNNNKIFENFQLWFPPLHNSETAVVMITNDLLLSTNTRVHHFNSP